MSSHTPSTTCLRSLEKTCAQCAAEPAPTEKLKSCSKCKAVQYRAHLGQHKPVCTAMTTNSVRSQGHGIRAILFAHSFGGVFSVMQGAGFKRHGRGILLCEPSCAAEEFCGPTDMNRPVHCRIRYSYVPESGFGSLARRWEQEATQAAPLDSLLMTADMMGKGVAFPGQIFIMIIASPFDTVQRFQAILMMNWLSEDHSARRLKSTAALGDWDWEMTPELSIITPAFYQEYMATRRQADGRFGGMGGGASVPPLDMQLSLTQLQG
ncbi:hypothetical protein BDK51DRAFT_31695 [Blyttiomyces helicus]|uniref:Uncharacterized protein n=1 Tax=Blyttiomyces helicus TaxID=388810 RepID=A0A4P9WBB1_9FUNG|nr:hypothetical protein BDK51DRAFT_31695 [Blyttiomyces helicus]|eukprot:RKO89911.1 hypothetical protein BDK51DRAFT_31695 [Blyttiomyces helicus]